MFASNGFDSGFAYIFWPEATLSTMVSKKSILKVSKSREMEG